MKRAVILKSALIVSVFHHGPNIHEQAQDWSEINRDRVDGWVGLYLIVACRTDRMKEISSFSCFCDTV